MYSHTKNVEWTGQEIGIGVFRCPTAECGDIDWRDTRVEHIRRRFGTLVDYRARRIVEMRLGERKTLAEVGGVFGISVERVRQICHQAQKIIAAQSARCAR